MMAYPSRRSMPLRWRTFLRAMATYWRAAFFPVVPPLADQSMLAMGRCVHR